MRSTGISILIILASLGCATEPPPSQYSAIRTVRLNEELTESYDLAWDSTVRAISGICPVVRADRSTGCVITSWLHERVQSRSRRHPVSRYYRARILAVLKRPDQQRSYTIEFQTEVQTGRGSRWKPFEGTVFSRDVLIILTHKVGQSALYDADRPPLAKPRIANGRGS